MLKESNHRYLKVEEIFQSKINDPKHIEDIYQIFGRFKNFQSEGTDYFSSYDLKTTDSYYSMGIKNGLLDVFILTPSEDDKNYLYIERALEIFSHLELERFEYWNRRNPHYIEQVFYYKTKDKKFSIQFDVLGRVDSIIWSKEEEIPVPDFSPQDDIFL